MYLDDETKESDLICNKNYMEDLNFTTHYSRMLLSLLGVWPMVSKNTKFREKIMFALILIVDSSLMLFITVPCINHIIFREKDPIARLVVSGSMGFFVANILKYSSIIYRRDMIADCLSHMEKDWKNIATNNDRKIMRKNVQVGRELTMMCGIMLYSCAIGYHLILPIWTDATAVKFNDTLRTVLFPGYELFGDVQSSPTYELVQYSCVLGAMVNSTVVVTSCNLAAIFVSHACGQFEIVVSRLETLLDFPSDVVNENVDVYRRIKFIVRSHVRVLGFSTKIEKVLREICGIEIVASTLIMCLDEYYCLMEWKNSDVFAVVIYICALISFSFNLYIICHIGELLKEQIDKIETAAYVSNWYDLPAKRGSAIIMILISMRNNPCKITAGRMVEISISTYGSIMKNTLAWLNLLRAFEY